MKKVPRFVDENRVLVTKMFVKSARTSALKNRLKSMSTKLIYDTVQGGMYGSSGTHAVSRN